MNENIKITAGYIDSIWKFFASVRLTVVVLLSLGGLSIIGTLIPQNQSPADYYQAFGPFVYQMLSTLDIFDMYHSWWFQCLIILLAVNIVVCSIERLTKTWRIIFPKRIEFNLQQFRQRSSRREFKIKRPAESIKNEFHKKVARSFRYHRLVTTKEGFAITVEKGRWTRLGVYGVHFSVVLLLIGGFIGSTLGFEGFVNIPEGEAADTIRLRNTGLPKTLPFSIRCEDFDVQFYEGGRRPKEFRSSLTILENGRSVLQKDIIVNDPLRYKGINIFQSSYGQMNETDMIAEAPKEVPQEIALNLQSSASGMIYTREAQIGKPVELPEGLGTLTLERYEQNVEFKGMALGPVLIGTLTPKSGGTSRRITLPLRFPKFDVMRRGDVIISVDSSVAPRQPRYYTGLQVTKDPGVGVVYTAFIFMIAGCAVTFFLSHQRLVVDVRIEGRGAMVTVSGTADKNKVGFRLKLQKITDQLEALASSGDQSV